MEDSSGNVADKEDLECVKKEIIGKFMGANKRTSLIRHKTVRRNHWTADELVDTRSIEQNIL